MSLNCECTNFDCSERVCAPDDCLCGYGTSGDCVAPLLDREDPEDCDGGFECAGIDSCNPVEG